ncbi:MAG: hypothetical protein EA370_11530 [Wenzhouxiangella sp.]|nr:MAG: hypothetical protein EA370_11530 [Wenzhouxiangella sp.]
MSQRILPFVLFTALAAAAGWWLWDTEPGEVSAGIQAESNPPSATLPLLEPWHRAIHRPRTLLAEPGGSGFEQLPPDRVIPLNLTPLRPEAGQELALYLGGGRKLDLKVGSLVQHGNGDLSIRASASGHDKGLGHATLTYGERGVFGRINAEQGLFLVHTDATGTWLLDLNDERIEVDRFHDDTLGQPALHPMAQVQARNAAAVDPVQHTQSMLAQVASQHAQASSISQIDVMFLYTPDMVQRYPGSLIETRLNHLVAIANQAMVDSKVPISVRLVHHRLADYTANSNNSATLQDLRAAAAGAPVPGFAGLDTIRQTHGADIVAFTWPHDIERRGSCGVAYFPRQQADGSWDRTLGVHIDNDGASNWSVCSDAVFTHELGHNLNAEHQRAASSGDDPDRSNYAFIREGRFHTVMGSFGTGDPDRYRRLDVFSNPAILCGGAPCGSTTPGRASNNAETLAEFGPIVAGYYSPTQPGLVERPSPSQPDSDGDGVVDWLDPYPFDPLDGQPPPESTFVFEPRDLRATASDDDWELLVASSGSDQVLSFGLDGRFRAVVTAPPSVDGGPILTEYTGMDLDDAGRLYLLASGDVRRYDRLSGELIDVYLSSELPGRRDLQSSFPRAMGFINNNQFLVLGDSAIERYDANGIQLNWASSAERKVDPDNWNDLLSLPLRSFATRQTRLYVAEALNNRILVFRTTHGFREPDLAGPDNGHIVDPWGMSFSPQGHLLLANGRAGNVLRFDPVSRQFMDEFVPTGSGGLVFARDLAFGPDGHLYVACQDSHRILRYDGASGAFMDVVAEAGEGGLDSPSSLRFAPVLDQIHPGHSGHFFNPARAGEGWLLEILDQTDATLGWFTYPPEGSAGEQDWLVGYGRIEGSRIFFDEVLTTRDGRFGPEEGGREPIIELWGQVEIDFANCNQATLHYQGPPEHGSGSVDVTRLIAVPGLPCGSVPAGPEPGAPGISGQWFDPDLFGQGWFLQETEPGQVFAIWFTYDASGLPAWIVGQGAIEERSVYFDDLLITRGTRFGPGFDADDVILEHWGTMNVTLLDCNRAVVDYVSALPEYGSGVLYPERLSKLDNLACELP